MKEDDEARQELTRQFLPGLQAKNVVQEAYEKDEGAGGQQTDGKGPAVGKKAGAAKRRKVEDCECAQIGKGEGNATYSRNGGRVVLARVRLVDQTAAEGQFAAIGRQDQRQAE